MSNKPKGMVDEIFKKSDLTAREIKEELLRLRLKIIRKKIYELSRQLLKEGGDN
ncbi:MAG: hypothetical protein AB1567_00455 [bacterium]